MKRSLFALIAFVVLFTLVAPPPSGAQQKPNTVTVELTDDQMSALKWWMENPNSRGDVAPIGDTEKPRTLSEWVLYLATPRLEDLVRRHEASEAGKLADAGKRVKKLNQKQCARLAEDLGVAVTTLPCGGGQ